MNTTYSPIRQYPGNPRFTITRQRDKSHTVKLTEAQYQNLATLLAEAIVTEKGTDEILFGNRFYSFDTDITKEQKPYRTGIEILGRKETYYETIYKLRKLRLEGVYSLSGNEFQAEIDCSKLQDIISGMKLVA